MASSHTLLSGLNDVHPCTDLSSKFHGSDSVAALVWRLGITRKRKCLNFDGLRRSTFRVYVAGHSWGSSDTMEVSVVRERPVKDIGDRNRTHMIEIPVTCYQIIGLHEQAEKDEIVKAVMHLRKEEIEEGYTKDTVVARQELLMDVRDKLLFEPEYAGNVKDKQPPKSSLCIKRNWLPGALSLLQEVGEERLVLEIGCKAIQDPKSKPFVHDLILSMALSECAIAKSAFEKNNIPHGFEALARAQSLLRSNSSLSKMMLLSQIEESLEDLAPACTLDLLSMPQIPENADRRIGAVAAFRELIQQGLDVESTCQVQDWPCFLSRALKKLMAAEIVELVPWDDLGLIRKNRKSLESQNQRTVIDFNSFYIVMMAHIALGFSSRKIVLISKAKTICECLMASEGTDLKFEENFCAFLMGQSDEAIAVEKLRQLQQSSRTASQNKLQINESREVSSANNPLESWLKESVLALFPDTRCCSSSLADFFSGGKRASQNRQIKKIPTVSVSLLQEQRDGDSTSSMERTKNLGRAVKQLAPSDLKNPWTETQKAFSGGSVVSPSVQLKRSLGVKNEIWKNWMSISHVVGKIIFSAAIGCVLVALFKSLKMHSWRLRNVVPSNMFGRTLATRSSPWNDSHLGLSSKNFRRKENVVMTRLKKALSLLKIHGGFPESSDSRTASVSSGLSTLVASTHVQSMTLEGAETLVKQWQEIKAQALGPEHDISRLSEILEGPMLVQWQALANAAKSRSSFWRFVLLQLEVLHAETLMDGSGTEVLEIEAVLQEAAELVGEKHPKNPTYYSPYRIRYLLKRKEDGSWRFFEGEILTP